MTAYLAQTTSGFGAIDWSVLVIGVLIAAVLVVSFVWGARRKRRELPPAPPSRSPAAPDPDSWTTPEEREQTGAPRPSTPPGSRNATKGGADPDGVEPGLKRP